MEFVQDLFLTAFVAIAFSFLIVKIFSVATFGGSAVESESKSGSGVDEKAFVRELLYGERLEVKPFESVRKAEFVGGFVSEADEFGTAPSQVEEIEDSVEETREIGDIEAELHQPEGKLEPERKFEDVVEEESVGAGEGLGLGQEIACGAGELKEERAQVDDIAESDTLGGEMEAELCLQSEKLESEARFEEIDEGKVDDKEVGEMVEEKSEPEMKSDGIVEKNVENKEEIEKMVPGKSESEVISNDIVEEKLENKEVVGEMVPENSESVVNSNVIVEEKLENKEEVGEMVLEKSEPEMKADDIVEKKMENKEVGEVIPEKSESEMKFDDNLEDKLDKKEVEGINEALETKKDHEVHSNESSDVGSMVERLSGEQKEVESDDDGWEGIERSELEKVFSVAAKYVEDKGELEGVGSDVQMEMYGLHKIATEGPCREPQPMALKVNARAKWNAWQKLGNMSPEIAMEQYVALLSARDPGWMKESSTGGNKQDRQNQDLELS